jgi:hypothetical protein
MLLLGSHTPGQAARGQSPSPWYQLAKLHGDSEGGSFGDRYERFGWSVAADPQTAFIGTFGGKVYIFSRVDDTWTLQQTLQPPVTGSGETQFGSAIAVSGSLLVVGDMRPGHMKPGVVHLYQRQTGGCWALQQTLQEPDSYLFGEAVAVDNQLLVVSGRIKAHIYRQTSSAWVPVFTFDFGNTVRNNDGISVAASGTTVLVGVAPLVSEGDGGAVYVLAGDDSGWHLQQTLTSGISEDRDLFGIDVAISGAVAAVSAKPLGDPEVYLFARSDEGWRPVQQLSPSDPTGWGISYSLAIDGSSLLVGGDQAFLYTNDGDQWTETGQLTGTSWSFGESVALAGGLALVGAPRSDENGKAAGAAWVFDLEGGTVQRQQRLLGRDSARWDRFGSAVAASGDRVLVGSPGDDTGTGSAYLFARSGSSVILEQKLLAPDRQLRESFGKTVAIASDFAVIGSSSKEDGAMGACYIFERQSDGWWFRQRLTEPGADLCRCVTAAADSIFLAGTKVYRRGLDSGQLEQALVPDGEPHSSFGHSVAVDQETGDIVAVGSPFEPDESGAVYLYENRFGAWQLTDRLTVSGLHGSTYFGWSVVIDGDTIAIGTGNGGKVFLFTGAAGALSLQQVLEPTITTIEGVTSWGRSLGLQGDLLVVGAYLAEVGELYRAGAAFLFTPVDGTWRQVQELVADDLVREDYFAESLVLTRSFLAVGSSEDDDLGPESGSVYLFTAESNRGVRRGARRVALNQPAVGDPIRTAGQAASSPAVTADEPLQAQQTAIPTLSPLGTAVLTLLFLLAATALLRR